MGYNNRSREERLDELIDRIIENEKLKKKFRRYENPHTPSSKEVRKNRTNFVSKTGLAFGKRGGYKGATRKVKEPNVFINSFDDICSPCGRNNKPELGRLLKNAKKRKCFMPPIYDY